MDDRFVYVFNEKDVDKFIAAGFTLIKQYNNGSVFVFVGKENDLLSFDSANDTSEYVVSDIIAL